VNAEHAKRWSERIRERDTYHINRTDGDACCCVGERDWFASLCETSKYTDTHVATQLGSLIQDQLLCDNETRTESSSGSAEPIDGEALDVMHNLAAFGLVRGCA
jgi:hypothetical protein